MSSASFLGSGHIFPHAFDATTLLASLTHWDTCWVIQFIWKPCIAGVCQDQAVNGRLSIGVMFSSVSTVNAHLFKITRMSTCRISKRGQ